MKQYTVTWWQSADQELLRLWLDSPERSRITDASRKIDRLLATKAGSVGKEVHEGLRRLDVGPLRVQFSVEQNDRMVRDWTVRLVDQ